MAFTVRGKYIILSVLLILASINFTRTAYDILKSSKRLDDLEDEVESLEIKKNQLNAEIVNKKTTAYVEEKARNDLNMIKPGEKVVVFITETISKGSSPGYVEKDKSTVLSSTDERSVKKSDNAILWYRLFFDK